MTERTLAPGYARVWVSLQYRPPPYPPCAFPCIAGKIPGEWWPENLAPAECFADAQEHETPAEVCPTQATVLVRGVGHGTGPNDTIFETPAAVQVERDKANMPKLVNAKEPKNETPADLFTDMRWYL